MDAVEERRLAVLRAYDVLDTRPEAVFDDIVRTVAHHFNVPVALISLIDADRQWFKARIGLEACETSREVAFCDYTIRADEVMVVRDATKDPRFCDNPLVTGEPHIRFYAGAPLITKTGERLGTLCAIDFEPRKTFGPKSIKALEHLAASVVSALDMRIDLMRQRRASLGAQADAVAANTEASDLRQILDTAVDAIITIDDSATVLSVNPACEIMFGYAAEDMVGRNVNMLMPNDVARNHDAFVNAYIDSGVAQIIGTGRNVTGRRSNGETFPIGLSVGELTADGHRRFVGIIRDETSRVVAEQRALESAQQAQEVASDLESMLDTAVDGVLIINETGVIERANSACEALFHWTPADLIGQNVKVLMPDSFAVSHDGYLNNYKETGHTRAIGIGREVSGLRADGVTFPIEISVGELRKKDQARYIGIVRDISERKQIDQMKTEFVSTVSHELRTPLTSIRGALGLIQSGRFEKLNPQAQHLFDIAYNNCDRLVRLVNDILDIEKMAAGQMVFDDESLDLDQLMTEALALNEGYAEQYGVQFAVATRHPNAYVQGDHARLLQVFANLLSNAAKFSPKGSTVEIALRPRGLGYRVAVKDSGCGIPVEFQDKIFHRFAQADNSDTRKRGGTGLGLSITKAIIDLHQGQIAFNTWLGKGTEFYFDLPAGDSAPAKPELEQTAEVENHI
jgi:PAS domain S-box-containing protein